jgi:hypothetical protein
MSISVEDIKGGLELATIMSELRDEKKIKTNKNSKKIIIFLKKKHYTNYFYFNFY